MLNNDNRGATPRRVIYNFVGRCNMACTFCYVPFDDRPSEAVKAAAVLRRVLAWDIEGLVIGGGDPLMYDYVPDLISMARSTNPNLFIQLDTNAIGASSDRLVRIAHRIDLIGLPVDGLSPKVCAAMRRRATHGLEMIALAGNLARHGCAVKINTVISRLNLPEVSRIGCAVEKSGAKIWSLYQFWPIGPIAQSNARLHEVSTSEFDHTVQDQVRKGSGIVVENSGAISARAGSYFFVAPTGRAFCTTPSGDEFIELGDLLVDENEVVRRWREYSDLKRNRERSAQRARVIRCRRCAQLDCAVRVFPSLFVDAPGCPPAP